MEDINLEMMREQYGTEEIDVRIQNPCDYNFKPDKLMNHPEKMTV